MRKVALSLKQTAKQYGGTAARYGGRNLPLFCRTLRRPKQRLPLRPYGQTSSGSPFRTVPRPLLVSSQSASEPPSPSRNQTRARKPFFPLPIRRFKCRTKALPRATAAASRAPCAATPLCVNPSCYSNMRRVLHRNVSLSSGQRPHVKLPKLRGGGNYNKVEMNPKKE